MLQCPEFLLRLHYPGMINLIITYMVKLISSTSLPGWLGWYHGAQSPSHDHSCHVGLSSMASPNAESFISISAISHFE